MKRIGIDAGNTNIHLSYEEAGKIHVKTYKYQDKEKLITWLEMIAPGALIIGTGTHWPSLKQDFSGRTETADEKAALIQGTNYLLVEEGKAAYVKTMEAFPDSIEEVDFLERGKYARAIGALFA
jgi:type II pantothenate kinase